MVINRGEMFLQRFQIHLLYFNNRFVSPGTVKSGQERTVGLEDGTKTCGK